jgi:recombination protein RecA
MKIGVMFGNPETTTGGNALKFYASVRLDIRKIQSTKDGEETIGNRTRVRVVKNKVAPPFKSAEFDILFNIGIDRVGELIDQGLNTGLLQKTGTWISYGPDRLGPGREQSRQTLKGNAELAQRLEHEIRVAAGLLPAEAGKEAVKGAEAADGKGEAKAEAKADAKADAKAAAKREPVGEVRETPSSRRATPPRA